MKIEPLGDAAYIVRDVREAPAYLYARHVEELSIPGVVDVVASYDTLGVYVEPDEFSIEALRSALEESPAFSTEPGKLHNVPVCYELGEDLDEVCRELGVSEGEFVTLHTGRALTCYAVGFAPGFPYLGYLPRELCGLPRLPAPRLLVPAGAVAITGDQCGIYPGGRPGGWRLIGATPLEIVSMEDAYFPIQAGDSILFHEITLAEYEARKGERL